MTKCIYKDVPFRQIMYPPDKVGFLMRKTKWWWDPLNYNYDFVTFFLDWKSDHFSTLYLMNRLEDNDYNWTRR